MKVINIVKKTAPKLVDGTLPDIDTDFASKDRYEIKNYIENRFGKNQVCSVGSYTTMKLKGLIKDLSRMVSIDFLEANIISSIIDKDDFTMLDLIKRANLEPKLKAFIKKNSDLFYILPTLLNQQKVKSIHPCAMIIFPNIMEAEEWCPMRTQQGVMVSEWDGTEMDDAGFLKDDILGILQLDKFTNILSLIKNNNKEVPDIYNLPHDIEVFRYFSNGWNGDVFQLGTHGLTEYTKSLKPNSINDLIAAVALYRPGPMKNHYHEIYIKCKNGDRLPTYLWGTEGITKDTYGLLIYQEQVMKVFQVLGNLTMREADDVRRSMGKKKLDVLLGWKKKVREGFLKKGASEKEFIRVWETVEEFAKYGFNKSHATAYAITGYISQYLKVHFPIEYWTVALDYADEAKSLNYLSEILQAKKISIKPPDINNSKIHMSSNQDESTIFWGIGSIKGIGEDTARQIIEERSKNGKYTSFSNFLHRHTYKGSKVKKQTYEALISAGSFDILYNFEGDEIKRHQLIKRFRIFKKIKVTNPKRDPYTIGTLCESWWWSLKQKELTGLAFVDYKKIAQQYNIDTEFCSPMEINKNQIKGIFRAFGGYIIECKIGRSKKGKYARLTIEYNYKIFKAILWSEEYERFKDSINGCEKSLIIFTAIMKYESKWTKGNQFTLTDNSILKILK